MLEIIFLLSYYAGLDMLQYTGNQISPTKQISTEYKQSDEAYYIPAVSMTI